jgi:hypothetical protein
MTVPHRPRRKQLPNTAGPPPVALTGPANDAALVPPGLSRGTGHCPTCTCHTFDVQTSRVLDLVVVLHEALSTATAQVGTVRASLEAEVKS